MKPTVARIAKAFGVDPSVVLDTHIRGNHPPLLFARAAWMALAKRDGAHFPQIAKDHGLGIATPYRWHVMHRQYMMNNPFYAEAFDKLSREAA